MDVVQATGLEVGGEEVGPLTFNPWTDLTSQPMRSHCFSFVEMISPFDDVLYLRCI